MTSNETVQILLVFLITFLCVYIFVLFSTKLIDRNNRYRKRFIQTSALISKTIEDCSLLCLIYIYVYNKSRKDCDIFWDYIDIEKKFNDILNTDLEVTVENYFPDLNFYFQIYITETNITKLNQLRK